MKKLILLLTVFCAFISFDSKAQSWKSNVYEGTIDGKISVTFYIQQQENECSTDLFYTSMYRYDKSGSWIQLHVTANRQNVNQFVLVEEGFSGFMVLKKNENNFNGLWISPDTKKQLKVELKQVGLSKKERETYEKKMYEVNYQNGYY